MCRMGLDFLNRAPNIYLPMLEIWNNIVVQQQLEEDFKPNMQRTIICVGELNGHSGRLVRNVMTELLPKNEQNLIQKYIRLPPNVSGVF